MAGAFAIVCLNTPQYQEEIIPEYLCSDENYQGILWPNYANVSTYFRCQGKNPVLEECPLYSIFTYVEQACTRCDRYIPAENCTVIRPNAKPVECQRINTDSNPKTCEKPVYFDKKFTPTCKGNDVYTYWPYYSKNSTEVGTKYYWCPTKDYQGGVVLECPTDKYFNFYAQSCVDCSLYVPPPPCGDLKFDKSNKCETIK